jgi:hypothetical protein
VAGTIWLLLADKGLEVVGKAEKYVDATAAAADLPVDSLI